MATKRIPEGAAYTATKKALPRKAASARRLPGKTPTKSATNPPPASVRKAAAKRVMPSKSNKGGALRGQARAAQVKSGTPVRPISNSQNPAAPNSQGSMDKSFQVRPTNRPMPQWMQATINPPARSGVPPRPLPIMPPSQRRLPTQGPTQVKKAK